MDMLKGSSDCRGKSVNDCIDKTAYPAYMGGIREIVLALNFCGRNAKICKIDWKDAYKHFWVKEDQLKFQWMEFLGRYFVELCLIFGSVSSVGLFDRGARVMVWLAVLLSGFQWWLVVQHLVGFH